MIDSGRKVIEAAESRGFTVHFMEGPPPMPFLRGDKTKCTPDLIDLLKAWRLEVIEELKREATIENPRAV